MTESFSPDKRFVTDAAQGVTHCLNLLLPAAHAKILPLTLYRRRKHMGFFSDSALVASLRKFIHSTPVLSERCAPVESAGLGISRSGEHIHW